MISEKYINPKDNPIDLGFIHIFGTTHYIYVIKFPQPNIELGDRNFKDSFLAESLNISEKELRKIYKSFDIKRIQGITRFINFEEMIEVIRLLNKVNIGSKKIV